MTIEYDKEKYGETTVVGNQADAIEIKRKNRLNIDALRFNFDQADVNSNEDDIW